jgi:hypothetical protein
LDLNRSTNTLLPEFNRDGRNQRTKSRRRDPRQ